ncbi:hypothetical protein ABH916_000721 [Peribacillus frigoritolerans]|uniref:hypothetical protein n=1 Tax=Peribacillus frigoritolerans TaxID=450367 RepID=UPI003835A210
MKQVLVEGRIREDRGLETYVTKEGREMQMPVIKKFQWEKFDSAIEGILFDAVMDGTFKEKVYLVMSDLHGMMLVPEEWIIEL